MSVRMSQYGREMDKNKKSLSGEMKRGADIASTTRKPDKFATPSMTDKFILGILRKFKGKNTKPLTTERTSQITSSLRNAGLSQSDIDKLRGKKK